jgi:hypothetical protein
MTFTRASPFPERMSWRRSGEIFVFARLDKVLFAARTLVLLDMHSAENNDNSTAPVTRRLRTWGRDIHFLQGAEC